MEEDSVPAFWRTAHPPQDELGVPVPLTRVLVHQPGVAIALQGALAYTSGVQLDIRWRVQKLDSMSEDDWDDVVDSLTGQRMRRSRRARRSLRWQVTVSDGRTLETESPMDRARAGGGGLDVPDPAEPRLADLGGGGGGSDTSWRGETSLWLTPLPHADFALGWEWAMVGLAPDRVTLAAVPIIEASQAVLPF